MTPVMGVVFAGPMSFDKEYRALAVSALDLKGVAQVLHVVPGLPAAQAGLQKGDVFLEFGGNSPPPNKNPNDFVQRKLEVAKHRQEPLDMKVRRGTQELAFSVQPSDAQAAAAISPAIEVQVQDAEVNLVTTATDPITLSINSNPAGGTLSGTFTDVAAVGGVATFSDISIDREGSPYSLDAEAAGLDTATSANFAITAVPPLLAKVGTFNSITTLDNQSVTGIGFKPKSKVFVFMSV